MTDPISNTETYERDPCSLVTSAQVEEFDGGKVKQTRHDTGEKLGNSCVWVFDENGGTMGGGFLPKTANGLNGLYLNNQRGILDGFSPQSPIEGYPAVTYTDAGAENGDCILAVGVRDDLAYLVDTQFRDGNPSQGKSCEAAKKVAAAAIKRMKGK